MIFLGEKSKTIQRANNLLASMRVIIRRKIGMNVIIRKT